MSKKQRSWDKRRGLVKREDYQQKDGWFELIVKSVDSLNGQQFSIDNCYQCDIFVLDWSGQVFVDSTRKSRLLIGPCESSIFVRDCVDLVMVVVCKQFRMRDCRNCRVALFCKTQPIIESSQGIQFDCIQLNYTGLLRKIQTAKLSQWSNNWWNVHDFTPPKENQAPHYSYFQHSQDKDFVTFDSLSRRVFNAAGIETKQQLFPRVIGGSCEGGQIAMLASHPDLVQRLSKTKVYKSRLDKLDEQLLQSLIDRELKESEKGMMVFLLVEKGQAAPLKPAAVIPAMFEQHIFLEFKDERE